MKKLFLVFAILISTISFSQQFRGMQQAELNLLKRYNIDYMSPWGRYTVNTPSLINSSEYYTHDEKKKLQTAYNKFLKWNNNSFSNNPIDSKALMDGTKFYYQIDVNPHTITNVLRIPIDRDDIEYIEIVEYTVTRFNEINYESAILIKYVYHPIEYYWNDTFYEDCGQCLTMN